MFDLATLKKINAAPPKVEDNHNRHCSFTGSVADGIVLHSAKLRNTVFLNCKQAAMFMRRFRALNQGGAIRRDTMPAKVDHLIESYFV